MLTLAQRFDMFMKMSDGAFTKCVQMYQLGYLSAETRLVMESIFSFADEQIEN